jgi:hypothetical protein
MGMTMDTLGAANYPVITDQARRFATHVVSEAIMAPTGEEMNHACTFLWSPDTCPLQFSVSGESPTPEPNVGEQTMLEEPSAMDTPTGGPTTLPDAIDKITTEDVKEGGPRGFSLKTSRRSKAETLTRLLCCSHHTDDI